MHSQAIATALAPSKTTARLGGFPWALRLVGVLVFSGLWAWMSLDVVRRARIDPQRPEAHKTDLTVYTGAGAAFLDGRDGYAVQNPRGWSYLYPPLFALMVAPLGHLDTRVQAGLWFWTSILFAWGCFVECRKLWQFAGGSTGRHSPPLSWAVALGSITALAVLAPAIECLQRGQVGIVLLYAMLLGLRLVLQEPRRFAWRTLLGGMILAWPIAVKLLPALPVAAVGACLALRAVLVRADRANQTRALLAWSGLLLGSTACWLLIPAGALGWQQNINYLNTWLNKVVVNGDAGQQAFFYTHGVHNQSLGNAALLLADSVRGTQREDRSTPQRRWVTDRQRERRHSRDQLTQKWVGGARLGVLALVGMLAAWAAVRGDASSIVALFGLANVATLVASPLSWTHYFVQWIPALPGVPLLLARGGKPRLALALAAIPMALTMGHYVATGWLGWYGWLGLGTFAWLILAALAVVTTRVPTATVVFPETIQRHEAQGLPAPSIGRRKSRVRFAGQEIDRRR